MSSTPWKPPSIKTSHQHNFTFYSQFAEITRWLLNSGPVSTFRKRLSRAVAGWVGGWEGVGDVGMSLIPTSHVQISAERSHFLARHSHVALWCGLRSLHVGFHFWVGAVNTIPQRSWNNKVSYLVLAGGGGGTSSLGNNSLKAEAAKWSVRQGQVTATTACKVSLLN